MFKSATRPAWMLTLMLMLGIIASRGRAAEIETLGLYIWRDTPSMHAFWKDCGYNLMQFNDLGWHFGPEMHENLYRDMAAEIDAVKRSGFKTDVILFANIAQFEGPGASSNPVGDRFNPRDPRALQERLDYLAKAVRGLKNADSFTFFAGDPGGSPPEIGEANVNDWIKMAREVGKVVHREAPHAEFNINTWAVTQWEDFGISAFEPRFWQEENVLAARIANEPEFVGAKCGIQFPLHNYYRSLALTNFRKHGIEPDLYPTADAVTALKKRGATRIWGWPYFLVDEADDGYIGMVWQSNKQAQAETRYIQKLMNDTRGLGLNGLITNFSYKGYLAEVLNTYAFARFAKDPAATPEGVLAEFAAQIATPETAGAFAQILRMVENHSTWEASLPMRDRLPALDVADLDSAWLALKRLEKVAPNPKPTLSLPEPPAEYIARIADRLRIIARAERIPETARELAGQGLLLTMSNANWAGDAQTSTGLDVKLDDSANRACAVISTTSHTAMPPLSLTLPIDLPRAGKPKALRLSALSDINQANGGKLYWDDVLLATIDAHADQPTALKDFEFTTPAEPDMAGLFSKGSHVIRLAFDKPAKIGDEMVTQLAVDAILLVE